MEIRKILDILEAGVRFKKPTKVLDEEPVAAFGQTYTPPPAEPDTRGAAAMASKSAPTASSTPPPGGTPFTNPTPTAASAAPAAATQTPPPNTNALGIAAQANVPGSPAATNAPKAAAAPATPANNQAAAPAKTYGGGYDPSKVQYAYGGPSASAQQSAASDASKKNVIGGGVQNAIAGAASPAAKPAAPSAPPSASLDAAKKNAIGGSQTAQPAAPDTRGAAAMASKSATPAPQNRQAGLVNALGIQGQATNVAGANALTGGSQTAQPAAPDTRGAAAMASKSATPAIAAATKPGGFVGTGMAGADFEESIEEDLDVDPKTERVSKTPLAPRNKTDQSKLPSMYDVERANKKEIQSQFNPPGTESPYNKDTRALDKGSKPVNTIADFEESVDHELAEMMRLSGLPLNEKAPPGAKAERMVKHIKKGYAKDGKLTDKEKSIAFATAWKAKKAGKLEEGLNLTLDESGQTLNHIVNRFKHEVKSFLNGEDMSENLYDALYDYYLDRGDMPYGVAKAREGDPYTWIAARFEADIDGTADVKVPMDEIAADPLNELAKLAGLEEGFLDDVKTAIDKATLPKAMHADYDRYQAQKARKEYYKKPYVDDAGTIYGPEGNPESMPSIRAKDYFDPNPNRDRDMFAMASGAKPASAADKVNLPTMPRLKETKGSTSSARELNECGDMDMEHEDRFNVSTNMSSDGTRSVNISAQGDRADELLQMLKMAGMRPHDDHDHTSKPAVVMISSDDEMMEQDLEEAKKRTTRYVNTPDEEYQTVASITRQGNDLNREKKQFAKKARLGDNPMAESAVDADLDAMLESILVREETSTSLIRPATKSQEEIAADWNRRMKTDPGEIEAEKPYRDSKTGKMVTPPRGATNPPPDSEFPPGDPRNSRPLKSKGK